PLHGRGSRRPQEAPRPRGSSRGRRGRSRGPHADPLLRRARGQRYRRRDDPRESLLRALRAGRDARGDVESRAGRALPRRAAASALRADDRSDPYVHRRRARRGLSRLPAAVPREGERVSVSRGRRRNARARAVLRDGGAGRARDAGTHRDPEPADRVRARVGRRDLVRFRGRVRRAAEPGRLHRALEALSDRARVQRAAVRCAAREPGTALHRARRRVLRPAREADPLRRRAARGAVLRQPPELRVRAHAEPPRGDAESRLFRRRASRMMRGGGKRHAGPSIMKAVTQQERLRTIAAAARRADLPVDPRTFVEHYYAQVGADDLTDDPKLLAAAALDHLEWAGTRRAKTAKVRAFNPTLEQNGWTSPHTVVQMVNDDMPFLVDSSTMTLDGLGHALHVTIHPRFAVERDGRGRLKSIAPPKSADGNARARLES